MTLTSGPLYRFSMLGPIAYFVAFLADVSTAVVLLATLRSAAARRSTFVLALAFAASALVMLIVMLVLPLVPSEQPVLPGFQYAGRWLYVAWHAIAAIGALVYVGFRRAHAFALPTRRFTRIATAITAALVGAGTVAAFTIGNHVPALGTGAFAGLASRGIGPLLLVLLGLAALGAFRMRKPNEVDRAVGFAMLVITLDALILVHGGDRYSASYYIGRALLACGTSLVLVAAVKTLVAVRMRLSEAELALVDVTEQSARRAGRIRAIWQIASQPSVSDEDRIATTLEIATAALRPGKPMLGLLSHIDGETLVIDAAAWTSFESAPPELLGSLSPGDTLELARTLQSVLYEEDCTRAWNDLTFLNGQGMFCEELGWNSFIGTPVTIARRTHFVSFISPEGMDDRPFAEDDIAYVDVVAAFFANTFAQQQQFERIQFQIEHDALTGLANRVQFRKAVRDEIAVGPFTLAILNIDDFRLINESQGNQIADEVLVEVASGLNAIASRDLIARMSGDEFAILLRGTGIGHFAAQALWQYSELFESPFHTGDRAGTRVLSVGASIGAARFPDHGDSVEDLMRHAGVALSVAKSRGGSTTMIFDHPMEAILEESHLRVVELNDAMTLDQLALAYQPTFDLRTREIVGAEALVRWDHPSRGRLAPAEFVEFAERNGLIADLSRWVFRRVVRDVTEAGRLPRGLRVYFNLAAQMLDDIPFIAELKRALEDHPVLKGLLGIEITETAAMQNVERSMHTIDLFRSWGLSVAIDDFGTGYSSLSYLKHLTVDMIKIDRTFVMGLPDNERDDAITEMFLRISDRFGFATLAEGIETEAQAAWLLDHGCRFGQGYLIAKPNSFEILLDRLGVLHAA
jgi:diguanylate cyclase (GGDEF)-like protein